jgi:hypothetical protein
MGGMAMSLVEQLADSLNMYVDDLEGFAQARYRTSRWTKELAVAVRKDLDGPDCVRSVQQLWWPGIEPTNGTGAAKMR